MLLRKILIIVLCFYFCDVKLAAMNAVADELLEILKGVNPDKVGITLGNFVDTKNGAGCKLDDQATSLSKHLRLSRHFGSHPSVLRSLDGDVKEEMIGAAHINPSLFNVNAAVVGADLADAVTREIFNLLFKTEKASFFVPETTTGGSRIILKTKLTGHAIPLLKPEAGLYSPDQDNVEAEKIPTNIFEICVRVQKQFTASDGNIVAYGSKKHPDAQTIVISIYPENPLDPTVEALPSVKQ